MGDVGEGMADIFYKDTVTVYNRTDGAAGGSKWYPTVLEHVRLLVTKGANVDKNGSESADTARLHIRAGTNDLIKPYMEPKAWQAAAEKAESFTLAPDTDFFVAGDTSVEDTTQEDFYGHMVSKYDQCYKVTNVDTYMLIPHLEVGGK